MRGDQITTVITLLFFGGLAVGFAAIVKHFYRAHLDATLAATRENEELIARAAAGEDAAAVPEALPVPPTALLHHRPAMGNAVIREEALWRQLQSDLIAVDLADMHAARRADAAVPTPIPAVEAAAENESANTHETAAAAAADPSPTTPATMRRALNEGGFVIYECCHLQDADSGAEIACACAESPSDAATVEVAAPGGVPSCTDFAVNHVKSPDACFFLFKAHDAPYGQSHYITATEVTAEVV